jgi:hypothetical protein
MTIHPDLGHASRRPVDHGATRPAPGGAKTICVTDMGALGGTLCTQFVQKALDLAGERGGTVIIPPGTFVCGTLHLRSNVTLQVENGATLLGSANIEDYAPGAGGHASGPQTHHFLVLNHADNVTICGGGTIDGLGPAFWEPQSAPGAWMRAKGRRVSPMVECVGCRDLRIEGVDFTNSPGWTLHLDRCDRVFVRGLRIQNDFFGPDTEGIDINACRDVFVSDCRIDTGDDAIVLKAARESRPCERVLVTNCSLRSNAAGLKIGTETGQDVRQVVFSNCVVHNATRAVAIYACDGGTVEDVGVSNIVCDTKNGWPLNRPIQLALVRRTADSPRGRLRNVRITGVVARTDGRVLLWAERGSMLENITLRDIHMIYAKVDDPDPAARTADGEHFRHDNPDARAARGAVVAENVRNLVVDGLAIDWPEDYAGPDFHALWGRNLRGGVLDVPLARPSREGVERFNLAASDIRVRE